MTTRQHARVWLRRLSVIAVLAAVMGYLAWFSLFRTERVAASSSLEDQFLYGSMGTETEEGTPYWIWLILPKVFPEYLPGPGGYTSIGLTWTEGHELPAGVTKRVIGFERIGVNCAFCHVSQVRLTADQGRPTFYPGGPGHQVRVQEYQDFLFKSAADPRFNSDTILREIEGVTELSLRERLLYRYMLIPAAKKALLEQKDAFAWRKQHGRPLSGPGRLDPFNPIRYIDFKEPDEGSIGEADIPSIWNQRARDGQYIHWNGLTKKFKETAITSAIGDGARNKGLDVAYLANIESYLRNLQAPKYPLAIDQELAARGAPVYQQQCASCHAVGQARTGTVIPLEEIGTDPHRSNSWTQSQVDGWKQMAKDYQQKYNATWNVETFNKQNGYVGEPLDGIWLRAPYLHNGSIPNLNALLERPEQRPKTFYRGNDVVDGTNVGFVSNVPSYGVRTFFLYDTQRAGNANTGHDYGTALGGDDKRALVEYMKTL